MLQSKWPLLQKAWQSKDLMSSTFLWLVLTIPNNTLGPCWHPLEASLTGRKELAPLAKRYPCTLSSSSQRDCLPCYGKYKASQSSLHNRDDRKLPNQFCWFQLTLMRHWHLLKIRKQKSMPFYQPAIIKTQKGLPIFSISWSNQWNVKSNATKSQPFSIANIKQSMMHETLSKDIYKCIQDPHTQIQI